MITRLTLASTVCHIVTFSILGLSHAYEIPYAGFIALVSLAIGLYMNKLVNEEVGFGKSSAEYNETDLAEYESGDPYVAELIGKPQIQPPETRNRPY